MSSPAALRWPLAGLSLDVTGRPIACPECGVREGLLLGLDLDDRSEDPSHMACPAGHRWLEPGMPRHVGAQLLPDVFESEPGLFAHLNELRDVHGGEES